MLKKSLLEGMVDLGPIVIEKGLSEYYRIRAIEFIREAELDEKYYQEKLNKALALIALAKILK